jgi:hypothetical protein
VLRQVLLGLAGGAGVILSASGTLTNAGLVAGGAGGYGYDFGGRGG